MIKLFNFKNLIKEIYIMIIKHIFKKKKVWMGLNRLKLVIYKHKQN